MQRWLWYEVLCAKKAGSGVRHLGEKQERGLCLGADDADGGNDGSGAAATSSDGSDGKRGRRCGSRRGCGIVGGGVDVHGGESGSRGRGKSLREWFNEGDGLVDSRIGILVTPAHDEKFVLGGVRTLCGKDEKSGEEREVW